MRIYSVKKNGDRLYGSLQNDMIFGGDGADHVNGFGGNDFIESGAGDDKIKDSHGNNIIYSGDGNDTVVVEGGDNQVFAGYGNDKIYGGKGNDTLHGSYGSDFISDVKGYNSIAGGEGSDRIVFSASSNRIYGGEYGKTGDGDRDYFTLASWHKNVNLTLPGQKGDLIADFEVGLDKIDLAALGVQASQIFIDTFQNGYMVNMFDGQNATSFGVRTGRSGALTEQDFIFAPEA
jgi:Ca2+-binding RTX toxin-like protein